MSGFLGNNIYTMDEWKKNNGLMNSMFDNQVIGKNGNPIKMDGWGSDAVGLLGAGLNLWQNNKAINAQEEAAQNQLDFAKDSFYKNWAMKMAQYRDYRNNKGYESAIGRAANEGRQMSNAERDNYLQDQVIYDANGNQTNDPTTIGMNGQTYNTGNTATGSNYNAVSAFAPTTAALPVQNSNLLQAASTPAVSALAQTTPVPKKVNSSTKGAGLSTTKKPQPNQVKKPENQ